MLFPTFFFQNPGPIRHRRLVTHMLTMAALQICDPVTLFVQMKPNNGLMHTQASLTSSLRSRGMVDSRACYHERRSNGDAAIDIKDRLRRDWTDGG
jgi:hypothetical protein